MEKIRVKWEGLAKTEEQTEGEVQDDCTSGRWEWQTKKMEIESKNLGTRAKETLKKEGIFSLVHCLKVD